MPQKKIIKIHFVDFWSGHDPETCFFTKILRRKYHVVFDSEKPDFLFYSCFGTKHQAYDCVRIYFTGENSTPDFNWCDYGIGFDKITFGDRYLRCPLYRLWISDQNIHGLTQQEAEDVFSRQGFCNFLYSNADADPLREQLMDALSTYKPVDSGGKCRNTLGYQVENRTEWQQGYKFTIACENSAKLGYITEKIFCALAADTIPIYWGNAEAAQDFNPARFIQAQVFSSLDALVDAVRELDNDKERFCAMLREPWFCEGQANTHPIDDAAFIDFVEHIVEQGPESARRIPQYGWTRNFHAESRSHARILRIYTRCAKLWRSLRKRLPF